MTLSSIMFSAFGAQPKIIDVQIGLNPATISLLFDNNYSLHIKCCWHIASPYVHENDDYIMCSQTIATFLDEPDQMSTITPLLKGKILKNFLHFSFMAANRPSEIQEQEVSSHDGISCLTMDEYIDGRNIELEPYSKYPCLLLHIAPLNSQRGINWILRSPNNSQVVAKQIQGEEVLIVEL